MSDVEITRISTKGQVVIPSSIRDEAGLVMGDHLAVFTNGDTILIKKLDKLQLKEQFEILAKELSRIGKERGIDPCDVQEAVDEVRHKDKSDGG